MKYMLLVHHDQEPFAKRSSMPKIATKQSGSLEGFRERASEPSKFAR